MSKNNLTVIIVLHLILILYSIGGIFSKSAAQAPLLSLEFCFDYGAVIATLFVYALVWQQIIKRMPLTIAFANKAITIIWGIIWGILFFNETVTLGKMIGAAMIMLGIVIYSMNLKEETCRN